MICKVSDSCHKSGCPHIVLHDHRNTCETQCTPGDPTLGPCDWVRPCCAPVGELETALYGDRAEERWKG
jgi:hypothetical protein